MNRAHRHPSHPTWRRRGVTAAVFAVALLLFAEAAGYAGLWALHGTPTGLAELRRERRALTAVEAAAEGDAAAGDAPDAGALAVTLRHGGHEVLQPYLGFVWTPEADLSTDRFLSALEVDRLGFLADPRRPAAAGGERPLEIGVFGGSVANILVLAGSRTLERLLRADPAVAARGVRLRNLALPGYKQPQQLMTLAWLRTLGETPDLVVNLDGFNEVALPPTENLPAGTHPLYPRTWAPRLSGLPDLAAQQAAGEAAYLRRRRGELARTFSHPLLAYSALANLAWASRDRRLAAAAAAAEERLAARRGDGAGYAAHGPPYAATEERMVADLVAAWANASRAMHALAAEAGIPYHHFLQPNQYLAGSKPLSAEERARFVRPGHRYGRQVVAAYPALVAEGARLQGEGVAFHDLTQLFADERQTVYGDDCCHLNGYGNRLLATAVAAAIGDDVAALARR